MRPVISNKIYQQYKKLKCVKTINLLITKNLSIIKNVWEFEGNENSETESVYKD